MTISRKMLCVTYALIGVVALVGTWGNIVPLAKRQGFWGAQWQFWQDVLVNESSRFITVDVLFLGLAVLIWMVLEARRLGIPGVWLYVVFSVLIAISVAFPLYLIHRERRLAAREPNTAAGTLKALDVVGIVLFGVGCTAYGVIALSR
jgi:hypothetical protein